MNIAILTPQFIVGGAETYVIRKSRWLKQQGHNVLVVSAGGCMVDSIPEGVIHVEYKFFKVSPNSISPRELRKSLKLLASILFSNAVDVIEAHNSSPIIYTVLSYRYHKIPYLFNDLLELDFNNNIQLRYIAKKLSNTSLFYVLTDSMKNYVEERCKRKMNVKVIPIPISSSNQFSDSSDCGYYLAVARFSLDKMYLIELIYAFDKYLEIMKGRDHISKLYIVGDGCDSIKSEIVKLATGLNEKYGYKAVVLFGSLIGDQLDQLYAHCTAFIGMGTSLLSAATYNKPCILASGETSLYKFAYGFWGVNSELDKNSIAGNIDYIPHKQTFTDALVKVTDAEFCKFAGVKAKLLFQQVYDLDLIMRRWEGEYSSAVSCRGNTNFFRLSYYLFLYNSVMNVLYKIKQFFKMVF